MICLPPIDPMMHYGDHAKTQGPGDRQLIHLFTFSCQPWEYIKLIILYTNVARDKPTVAREKNNSASFSVRGILYTRLIYLRLKTTDFWATYGICWTISSSKHLRHPKRRELRRERLKQDS